jgi:hypothetical protein
MDLCPPVDLRPATYAQPMDNLSYRFGPAEGVILTLP